GRIKDDGLALACGQLLERRRVRAGLAEGAAVERRDLIGADDDDTGRRAALRLGGGEPRGERLGRLGGVRRLVDLRSATIEGQREPRKQLAAVAGRGREQESRHGG